MHRFLCEIAYWALGRPRETQDRLIDEAQRVVGLYDGDRQIGFCRAVTDGNSFAYLADVYVLEEYRGRGLRRGARSRDDRATARTPSVKWLLHTTNMHALYRKFGFAEPDYKVLERPSTRKASESG